MIKCVVYYEVTGAAGVEDAMVSVLDTGTVEIGGGECSRMEGGPKNGFAFAVCTLMDYSIIDIEVADVLGDAWSLIHTNERKGVVAAVARVVAHPFSTWMVSVPFLGLSRGMHHSCWISGVTEKSGWGTVIRSFIFLFHIWFNDVSEDGDVMEV